MDMLGDSLKLGRKALAVTKPPASEWISKV